MKMSAEWKLYLKNPTPKLKICTLCVNHRFSIFYANSWEIYEPRRRLTICCWKEAIRIVFFWVLVKWKQIATCWWCHRSRSSVAHLRDPLINAGYCQFSFVLQRILNQLCVCEWRLLWPMIHWEEFSWLFLLLKVCETHVCVVVDDGVLLMTIFSATLRSSSMHGSFDKRGWFCCSSKCVWEFIELLWLLKKFKLCWFSVWLWWLFWWWWLWLELLLLLLVRFRLISGDKLAISSSLKLNSQDRFLSSLSSPLSRHVNKIIIEISVERLWPSRHEIDAQTWERVSGLNCIVCAHILTNLIVCVNMLNGILSFITSFMVSLFKYFHNLLIKSSD